VRENLETFLATVREERGKGLPYYVEEELRRYQSCWHRPRVPAQSFSTLSAT
jgi:hypothetical protein